MENYYIKNNKLEIIESNNTVTIFSISMNEIYILNEREQFIWKLFDEPATLESSYDQFRDTYGEYSFEEYSIFINSLIINSLLIVPTLNPSLESILISIIDKSISLSSPAIVIITVSLFCNFAISLSDNFSNFSWN